VVTSNELVWAMAAMTDGEAERVAGVATTRGASNCAGPPPEGSRGARQPRGAVSERPRLRRRATGRRPAAVVGAEIGPHDGGAHAPPRPGEHVVDARADPAVVLRRPSPTPAWEKASTRSPSATGRSGSRPAVLKSPTTRSGARLSSTHWRASFASSSRTRVFSRSCRRSHAASPSRPLRGVSRCRFVSSIGPARRLDGVAHHEPRPADAGRVLPHPSPARCDPSPPPARSGDG
jgi:hypothetical protein